jgi:long-chain acyl-CoA synthetase
MITVSQSGGQRPGVGRRGPAAVGRGGQRRRDRGARTQRLRIKDLIIRGGYNVYPREVEEVLYAHPAIAEAAVIGVPDDWLGEEVHAVVAIKPGRTVTEAELIESVRQKLAAYKYPRTVEFRDSLPKGPSGKILKKELHPS